MPARQIGLPLSTAHLLPHRPQLLTSLAMATSQPFIGILSQSAKPMMHPWRVHTPSLHMEPEFGTLGHAMPHPEQLFTSLARSTSQPFIDILSQSASPALHMPT